MRRVGFTFTQTISQNKKDYTMSNKEILQAAELHAESEFLEWVTAVVTLEVNEDGGADVHFEAFQMSDMGIRLFKEWWFDTEIGDDCDPKLSKMKKDVVVGVKDTREIDNDFFLVVVKIFDHQVSRCQCRCSCIGSVRAETDSFTRRLPAPNRVHGQYLLIYLLGLPIHHSASQYVTLIFWEYVDHDLVAQL